MSNLLELDTDEITGFTSLSSSGGLGNKIDDALTAYTSRLSSISNTSFGPEDNSTAHEVIDALYYEVSSLKTYIENVDSHIDSLLERINEDIIQRENSIADGIGS